MGPATPKPTAFPRLPSSCALHWTATISASLPTAKQVGATGRPPLARSPACAHAHSRLPPGSGKTFTMEGGSDETSRGMIPRAVEQVTGRILAVSCRRDPARCGRFFRTAFSPPRHAPQIFAAAEQAKTKDWQYAFTASFLEVTQPRLPRGRGLHRCTVQSGADGRFTTKRSATSCRRRTPSWS